MNAGLRVEASLFRWIAMFLTVCAFAACNSETTEQPEPAQAAAVYQATTNDDGVAYVESEPGKPVFTAVALESSGDPLSGVDVTYFGSAPEPLVAFNDAATGEPLGTFAVTAGDAGAKRGEAAQPAEGSIQTGVFILDMLDIGGGRLYDPARDGFQPVLPNTLREIRSRLSYEDVAFILSACPGIQDLQEQSLADLDWLAPSDDDRIFDIYDSRVNPEDRMAAHRYSRVATWAVGRPPSYRLHVWRSEKDGRHFFIPLGARAIPTIDSPQNGHTFTGDSQRIVEVSGGIAEEPVFLTADGGHVDIHANGALLSGALSVGGDGSGGTAFSVPGGVQLAPGENTLEIVAYMGEAGWGFATPVSGEVGRASVVVSYEAPEDGVSPVLSSLSYTPTVQGPSGPIPVGFHFRDVQADISLFHWRANGMLNGDPASGEFEHPVGQVPGAANMSGNAEGDCSINFNFGDVYEGGWVDIEIWVIDAAGHASNHLAVHITILAATGAPHTGAPGAGRISLGRD